MAHALIVDDIQQNQVILGEILGEMGVSFDCAACIEEAVKFATSVTYDVVLMDLAIPRKKNGDTIVFGGLEAAKAIHIGLQSTKLPIIAVTANGMRDIHARVREAGVSHVVEKSTNFSQRIETALNGILNLQRVPRLSSIATELQLTSTATQIGVPEPTTLAELRKRIADLTSRALAAVDHVYSEVEETDRDSSHQNGFIDLKQHLELALARLINADDGPKPSETFGHWVVNLLLPAENRAAKLVKHESRDHFGRLSNYLQAMKSLIDECFTMGKSELAQQRQITPIFHETVSHAAIAHAAIAPESVEPTASRSASPPTLNNLSTREAMPKSASDESRRLVLIVDDDHESRRDLEAKLKRLNYRVVSCESSVTALDLLDLQRFDVCLLDLDMPDISGLQMIGRIRESATSGKASIIIVSGSTEKFAAADAIEQGADDYLEKPANERLLQARIRSCLRQTDARLEELGKFLPRHIVGLVINNKDLLEKPAPADISVIVCDIRGFSRVSERIGPVQTINWISDVMNELSQIILEHGGTIIDYVGDEIMAMWGAPVASPQHASDACICAAAIQLAAQRLSEKWYSTINTQMQIGIGINSGLAVVGNTGSKHRIKYGPLGDTVNVASRVQGATKYLHCSVLITQGTASRIDGELRGRRVCSVRVQNINEPVHLFELASCQSEASRRRRNHHERALAAFESQNLTEALSILAEQLVQDPNDGPSKLLMMRVIQAQLGGVFDPIWTLPGK